ncbi:MAG: hypothetical protein HYX78_12475 [Armatimonadetes bacterium]|nr:hypothetical protein [Armatimonadota bacterium]
MDFAGSRKGVTGVNFTNSKTTTNLVSKPTLLDAVIGYKLAGDNKLNIGQFKIPFSLENLTSSTNLDLINRSQVVEALVPGRDIGAQGRDVGVQFSGIKNLAEDGAKQIEYYMGLFNGAGINAGDDNDRKDPAVRFVLRPGLEGLSLGLSHYNGATGATRADHVRTGGEAVYFYGPWALKIEYIAGKDGSVHRKGHYATLVRKFRPLLHGAVRFDRLDPNTGAANDVTSTFTAGLSWFLNKDGYSRWQLNYEHRWEQGAQISNDQILAQFQAGF